MTREATPDDVMRVMTPGGQVRLMLIGGGMLTALVLEAARNPRAPLHRHPDFRPMRLAFGIYDRIRTGEIPTWTCMLCDRHHRGLGSLSLLAVVDHLNDPPDAPALTGLVCGDCDCDSAEETARKVREAFEIEPENG